MERIAQGRSATLTHKFLIDGVATVVPDAQVRIVTATGTVVVDWTAATGNVGGGYDFTVTPAQTALLDTWTVSWRATIGGQSQVFSDYVEVVGGFLFTVAQAKAIQGMTTQTTSAIAEARTLIETALEQVCGRAFVPRYSQETLDGSGSTGLLLSRPDVLRIRSVTVDGVAYTAGQLAQLAFRPTGLLHNTGSYWTTGYGNVTVGYEHGMAFPPPELTRAALILAKAWLGGQNRPIDDRAVTFNATEGGTYSLAVPGRNGSVFGHPDVDSVVSRYSLNVGVA